MRTTFIALAICFSGCLEAKNPHEDAGDADIDADTDVDADSDTDTGSESDCSDFEPAECNGIAGAQPGDRFPPYLPFEFPDCQGNDWSYGCDFGKVVLYNLSAGWCKPCREETRADLMPFYEEHRDEGFEIVQVLYENDAAGPPTSQFCQDWQGEFDMSYSLLFDPAQANSVIYTETSTQLPLNIVIDRQGCVALRLLGTSEGFGPIEDAILEALAQ